MATTSSRVPKVPILGHSFVRRLINDLRALYNFAMDGTAEVHIHRVGGRTVKKYEMYDLGFFSRLSPVILILVIGTYDLSLALQLGFFFTTMSPLWGCVPKFCWVCLICSHLQGFFLNGCLLGLLQSIWLLRTNAVATNTRPVCHTCPCENYCAFSYFLSK